MSRPAPRTPDGQGLRVLMIGPFPRDPQRTVGGVEAATAAIASALVTRPEIDRVVVASVFSGGDAPPAFVDGRLEVRHIRVPTFALDIMSRSALSVRAVRPLVRAFQPHVVHGQGIGRQGQIAVRLGAPAVVTVHGLVSVEARMEARGRLARLRVGMHEAMVRRVLDGARVVVSISDYDARALDGLVQGRRVKIPNAVPAAFFADAAPASVATETVMFAGVLTARKNVVGLVEAFAQVRSARPRARLVIAGPVHDTGELARVKARIGELGLEPAVDMLGHIPTEGLISALQACDVLTLFSHEETLPTIIAQAMAAGKPVVASQVGGIAEMLDGGAAGRLVAPGDVAGLATRLIELLARPELRAQLGRSAREFAQGRYSAEAVARATVAAYDLALGDGHRG